MKTVKKMALLLLVAAASNSATAQTKVVLQAGEPYTIVSNAEGTSSGGAVVLYQWYRDGSAIAGATEASYTVPSNLAVGANVEFKRAAYVAECDERKYSNTLTITWCSLMIGGVCWADVNVTTPGVFAAKPDMYTDTYQWNQPATAWSPSPSGAVSDWNSTITAPAWTSTPCPEGWRLPTFAEIQALYDLPGEVS